MAACASRLELLVTGGHRDAGGPSTAPTWTTK
jgi:hypothetical protein